MEVEMGEMVTHGGGSKLGCRATTEEAYHIRNELVSYIKCFLSQFFKSFNFIVVIFYHKQQSRWFIDLRRKNDEMDRFVACEYRSNGAIILF